MQRRIFLGHMSAAWLASSIPMRGTIGNGPRLARAARSQIGVTKSYDSGWTHLSYPGGDVPRSTGVCADVIIRAARDGLGLDLQQLVHQDMARAFDEYPSRKVWGLHQPDASIDHRRVLNLQTYWQRSRACVWSASPSDQPVAGDSFPTPPTLGDFVTWLLDGRLPHVGVIVSDPGQPLSVVHNIGNGVEQTALAAFQPHRAAGHYRWPAA